MIDATNPNRPMIGFLSANIHIGASRVLWPGILDAVVAAEANLICFPGGRLKASELAEAMRNLIYHQVDTDQLDGLVMWTSALAGSATSQEVIDFHETYHAIPIVDLAASTGFRPTVTIDGNQGMRALLYHLIENHGYERIALIRGPEWHPYALERHQAFVETLQEKRLLLDERLISPVLGWNKGAEAMSVFLDERDLQPGRDFQAVVAASDLLAIGAIRLMAERGIHVPTDVAVGGFNDIEEGRLVRPPLTSVSLPFYEQGRQSAETLLSILADHETPDVVTLESRLLVRQSCGCPSWSEKLATVAITAVSRVQDPNTGLWWQVLDQGDRPGNYLEASGTSMYVYAIAKGVRQGHLDKSWLAVADKGFYGLLHNLVTIDEEGRVDLHSFCSTAGLGGTPYRDASYDYYVNEPIITNDLHVVGAFLNAAVEMEIVSAEKAEF